MKLSRSIMAGRMTAAISEAQVGLLRGDTPALVIALQLERQIVAAEFAS